MKLFGDLLKKYQEAAAPGFVMPEVGDEAVIVSPFTTPSNTREHQLLASGETGTVTGIYDMSRGDEFNGVAIMVERVRGSLKGGFLISAPTASDPAQFQFRPPR